MVNNMNKASMTALTVAVVLANTCAVVGAENPACPGGICPGLGNSFYLPSTSVLTASTSGTVIFVNRALDTCATVSKQQRSNRALSTVDSMESFVKTTASQVDVAGSYKSIELSVKATATSTTGQSSSLTTSFHSTHMDITQITSKIDFQQTAACMSKSNLVPQLLTDFEALPTIDDPSAESSVWQQYGAFLKSWGSHVQIAQEIGSRYQYWASSTSSSSSIVDTLQAKVCAEVEGVTETAGGWSVQTCAGYNSSTKSAALRTESYNVQVILGGSDSTRTALTNDITKATLDAFVDSYAEGTQAVNYQYSPIWHILQQVYAATCTAKGMAGCANIQRAVNIQAYYEGLVALGCDTMATTNSKTYQSFQFAAPTALGIKTFVCHAVKTGCMNNDDCHLGGAGSVCYCYGPSCIDTGAAIAGTSMMRNKVRGDKSGSYSDGVNKACHYHFIAHCNCDTSWSGGLASRNLYQQSASSMLSAQLKAARRSDVLTTSTPPWSSHVSLAEHTDDSLVNLLNSILTQYVPEINPKIDAMIVSEHLDPYANVASGTKSAGSINLGVCHATAYVEYSITNLVGLKGLTLTGVQVTSATAGKAPSGPIPFSAVGVFHAGVNDVLKATVHGKATAKCGFIHPHVGLGGTVEAHGLAGHGTINVKGAITIKNAAIHPQITELSLAGLDLSVSKIDVHLNSLGIFHVLVDPIADVIIKALKGKITDALQGKMESAVNNAIQGALPFPKSAADAAEAIEGCLV